MSEYFGHKVTIREQVTCIEPLPPIVEDFFKSYAKILSEMYGKKETAEVNNESS
jgi:hypothetical protein